MSETDGLLAEAQIESDDNQQQTPEETISHMQPETDAPIDAQSAETGDEENTRPEWLPEKFKTAEDMAGAYAELQKKFSQGKHKAPDQYDQSVFMDAGIPEDDELYSTYRDWAKDNGISQDAFDQLAGKFIEMAGAETEQAEISYKEEYEKLGPNADMTIKSMTQWAQSLVNKGVWGQDDFDEFKIMGGTAQGIRALQKIRSYYGDKAIPVDVGNVDGAPSKEELQSMISKPEYQSDPAYRAKVEKMFETVYGTEQYSAI
jgi:hypothetical protein